MRVRETESERQGETERLVWRRVLRHCVSRGGTHGGGTRMPRAVLSARRRGVCAGARHVCPAAGHTAGTHGPKASYIERETERQRVVCSDGIHSRDTQRESFIHTKGDRETERRRQPRETQPGHTARKLHV